MRLYASGWPKGPSRRHCYRPQIEVLGGRFLPSGFALGPLVQVSQSDPFAGCTANQQPGTFFPDSEVEPRLAVDPTNPNHLVGFWEQDLWQNNGSRGLVAGVSFDRGRHWQQVVVPGLSRCSGGTTLRVSNPWLSFAPNGNLYSIGLPFDPPPAARNAVFVNKSTNGGLTWSDPLPLVDDNDPHFFNERETITADPTDSRFAYAVWDRVESEGDRPEMFARTTDGGRTWEPARVVFTDGLFLGDSRLLVLPDGSLVDAFFNRPDFSLVRSTDKGETWGPLVQLADAHNAIRVRDPNTGQVVRAGTGFDVAVDPKSGNLYAVWMDSRFSGDRHNSIAFVMSTDGGLTWSKPVQINQTPTDIPEGDQQAFLPSVQVAADGTVGVTYYDFRFNDPAQAHRPITGLSRAVPTTPEASIGGTSFGSRTSPST